MPILRKWQTSCKVSEIIADLKEALAMIHKFREFEDRHVGNVVTPENPSAPRLSLANRIQAASG
jgi:hypothetical protein